MITDFPRQNRRGLIEAPGPSRNTSTARPPFPGRIAGASLKLLPSIPVEHGADGFPRQNRRGLIEAVRLAGRPQRNDPPFPGRIAGASLKLPGHPAAGRARGELSPAESPGPH